MLLKWSRIKPYHHRPRQKLTNANKRGVITGVFSRLNTLSLPLRRFHISIVYFFWLRRSHTLAWFCSSERLCFPAAFSYHDLTGGNSSTRTACWELKFHWQLDGLTMLQGDNFSTCTHMLNSCAKIFFSTRYVQSVQLRV